MSRYAGLSLWFDTVGTSLQPRAALAGDLRADVAIVGAGYTGLWTAYYLLEADPSLRVVLLEAEIAGFGASGRNGGWCSALFPVDVGPLAAEVGRSAAVAQYQAMSGAVTEVGRVCEAEGIEADFAQGGTVVLARTEPQLLRAHEEAAQYARYGLDLDVLDAASARKRVGATDVLGATFTPHCAALHPAKLARGLASVVEGRGAQLFESTRVTAIEPGLARTTHGTVRADVVVRATEGYTARLAGRVSVPLYSLMIATAPLPDAVWSEIGLRDRETFADLRHLIIYGQRTADGRLAFGGRGAPYHFGSRVRDSYDRVPKVFAGLRDALVDLFPVLTDTPITHRWGGPLGVTRDWHASVGLDRTTGLAWAGGYVGDGVSTTNLAGRTLGDLILRRDSGLTALPWVNHQSPDWEPEPARWLGANAALRAMTWADAAETRHGRASRVAGLVEKALGR